MFNEIGGAYVNCWIQYAWQDGAEVLARYEVEKEWTITEVEEVFWVEMGDYEDDPDNREYFLQAQIDGGCFVYHQYPLDAPDEDADFQLENASTSDKSVLRTNH